VEPDGRPDDRSDDGPAEQRPDRLRWLGRGVVAAIGLWFIFDGLSEQWSGAGVLATVVAVVGVVLLVAFGVVLLQQRTGR
jgi:di/tricarboxylate transporter